VYSYARRGIKNSEFWYNGLDRVDSSKHYTLDNVVPCCTVCNRAKSNLTVADFYDWIAQLTAYQKAAA